MRINLGDLRERIGDLERRLEQPRRTGAGETTSPVAHATESSLLGSVKVDVEALADLRSAFSRHARTLGDLAQNGADGPEWRQVDDLVRLGLQISGADGDALDGEDWRELITTLGIEVERRLASLAASEDERNERNAEREALSRIYQQLLAGERPAFAKLQSLVESVLRDQYRDGTPTLDFTPSADRPRNLVQQSIHHARVVAFLAESDAALHAQREALVLAAILMDVGLYGLAAGGSLSPSEAVGHAAASVRLLEKLGVFDPAMLEAIGSHHGEKTSSGKEGSNSTASRLLQVVAAYLGRRWPRLDQAAVEPQVAMRHLLADAESGAVDLDWSLRLLELSFYPVGTLVELAGGEWAEVVATQRLTTDLSWASLPIVRIVRDRTGVRPNRAVIWNLLQRPDSRIVRVLNAEERAFLRDVA